MGYSPCRSQYPRRYGCLPLPARRSSAINRKKPAALSKPATRMASPPPDASPPDEVQALVVKAARASVLFVAIGGGTFLALARLC
jgi:hypothetical protein